MFLPWEYGVRNLARRPLRTALTLAALSTVVTLILMVVGFIRGLENSIDISGDPNVVLVFSLTAEDNPENSAVAANTPNLLTASIDGIADRYGQKQVSPELFLATRIKDSFGDTGIGLVRGVTESAASVRQSINLASGRWPESGEVMIGRLASTKLGTSGQSLNIGDEIEMEGLTWTISGHFSAGGKVFDSEIWCRLEDLQMATKRQDISLVAVRLKPDHSFAEIDLFCKERIDLELSAITEKEYYQSLQQFYRPVRVLAWAVVWLVSAAGIFTGLNMMYGSVAGRVREIATLRAIGYRRRSILIGLMQEGLLLAAAASLIAGLIAIMVVDGLAVKFTMGAFRLQVDSMTLMIGFSIGLMLGVLGAMPPAIKALSSEIAPTLKAS